MKVLIAAATLAFSASSAFAMCADKMHTASTAKETTVASADTTSGKTSDPMTTGSVSSEKSD